MGSSVAVLFMRLGQAPTLCSTRRGAIACHYLSDPFARVPIAKYGWVRQWRQQGQGDFHDSPGCRADQHVPSRAINVSTHSVSSQNAMRGERRS